MSSDPFRKVRPGDDLAIPASTWNSAIDRAKAFSRSGGAIGGGSTPRSGWVVPCLNDTGADLGRAAVVGLAGPIFGPSDSLDAFKQGAAFRGVTPTAAHADRFAVTLGPIPANQVGRAYVAGVFPARIAVASESHTCAHAAEGDTAKLASGSGPAQILWKESGTGTKWAIVRRVGVCGALPEPEPPDDCPAGITACWTVTSDGTTPISGVRVTLWDPDDVLVGSQLTEGDGSTCFVFDGPPGEYVVAIEPFCLLPLGGPVTLECGPQSFAVTADSLDPDCVAGVCGCDYLPLEIGWQVDYTRSGDPMVGRSGRATLNALISGYYSSPLIVFDAPWNFGGSNYRSARVLATCSLSSSGGGYPRAVGIFYYQFADGTGGVLQEGTNFDCVSGASNEHGPFCPDGEYSRSFCTRDFFSNAIPYMTVSWP